MATLYPSDIDSFTNPTSTDTLASPDHAEQHADINDAMEAVQAELGATPSNGRANVGALLSELIVRASEDQDVAVLSYDTSVEIDFDFDTESSGEFLLRHRRLDLTGNVTLTTANLAAGRRLEVLIFADGSTRNLTLPSWRFIGGAAPTTIAANKVGKLVLISTGTTDGAVVAEWTVQP